MTAPTEDVRPQDLARLALRSALAATRDRTGKAPVTRTRASRSSAARTDDRDPQLLGGLLEQLLTDHGWAAPVTGGSIPDAWPRACPEYAEKVTAGHYDPDTGRLDLHPTSPTYASQLRLLERALIDRINTAVGADTVRSLRVVPPGKAPGTPPARAKPRPRPGATAATPQHRIPEAPPRESVRDVGRHGTHGPGPAGRNAWARAIARARRERHQAPTARRDGELDPPGPSITNDTDSETNAVSRGQDR